MNELTNSENELEQRSADKLDKYKDYLLGRGKLTPSELKMLEKYRKAFSWRCKGFSPQHVKQMLMQDEGSQYAQAARILQEATELYGRVEEIDAEGTKRILIENLYLAMSIAIREKDANAVISTVKEIGKLSKVYTEQPQLSPADLMPKRNIVFNRVTVNNYAAKVDEGKEDDYEVV